MSRPYPATPEPNLTGNTRPIAPRAGHADRGPAATDLRHVECFAVHARWSRCWSSTPYVRALAAMPFR
jgi:hypothetical protein